MLPIERKTPMPKKSEKKPNRRKNTKYPALVRNMNLKSRQYYIEAEYLNGVGDIRPLTDKEKEFLNKFYSEYIITSFKKDGTDLHKSDEERRALYKENNKRNIDLYNLKLRTGQLESFNSDNYDKIVYDNLNHIDFEEALTNQLEIKEIAEIIVDAVEKLHVKYPALEELVKKRFPEYFHRNFSEKELKEMKKNKNEVGETLYFEAKIILENE